jgi:cyclophilin family peptidyl-prolyl cis-trans isomerase
MPEQATHCVLETSLGELRFRFLDEAAPRTCRQIRRLVAAGFYDGLTFYRVVPGHVIQAGANRASHEPTVPSEAGTANHVRGAVGLARWEDPDSGSTELYVCLADRPRLDGVFTVLGLLDHGFDVLDRIAGVELEEGYLEVGDRRIPYHAPVEPVVIRRATLVGA